MSGTAYELWDRESANLLHYEENHDKMVEMVQRLFNENRLSSRLDELALMVYNAEDETKTYTGAEEIESWLSENE